MRRAGLLLVIALAAFPGIATAKFHYSHRVSISGSLVDHWTMNDTSTCGAVGDGTVTVDFHQKAPAKALVEYVPVETKWFAFVPRGGLVGGLPPKPVAGTISFVDNTVATNCSEPIDKSGCGSFALRGKADLSGNRRGFTVDMGTPSGFRPPRGGCGVGQLDDWTQPPEVAGNFVQVKMPRPRSFKRRHTVTVTATTHRKSSFGDITDDVTRTVTVTFTRLS
jgi:hypothetical protein